MNDSSTGPLIVAMLFIVRCLIPLAILFGISYLLQHFGLVESYGDARGSSSTPKAKEKEQIQSDKIPAKKKSRSIPTSKPKPSSKPKSRTKPKSSPKPKRKQTTKGKSVSKRKRSGRK